MRRVRTCTATDCLGPAVRQGRCEMHYAKWRSTVTSPLPGVRPCSPSGSLASAWRGNDIGYAAMHDRVKTARGAASDHLCIDCGDAAAHWSYDHLDPEERLQPDGRRGHPYSLKIEHYQPRCAGCHARFDHANKGGLSAEAVAQIRQLHAEGKPQRAIARTFKVAQATISDVIHGRWPPPAETRGGPLDRCDRESGYHSMPHRGCILR
jgi:hypothetical protein